MVVNEGLNYILGVTFSDETQDSTHYVGLKGTGSVAAGDTLASHAGWSEITAYADDRKAWVEGGASGQSISNTGNAAAFAINGAASVYGAFLCATASGTAQELICAVDFTSDRTLADGDKNICCRKTSLKTVKPKGMMSLWQRCAKLMRNHNERPETDITLRSMTMGSCEANA